MQISECTSIDQIVAMAAGQNSAIGFDPAQFERDKAEVHLIVLQGQKPAARCSLWFSETPRLDGKRVGAIGHYGAESDEAACKLLTAAIDRLRRAGAAAAVGPMDGNTWRRYRFLTEAGSEPAFFMEPTNDPSFPGHFLGAAFRPLAEYFSALNTDLSVLDERLPAAEQRLCAASVVIHSLCAGGLEQYLPRIYKMSRVAFQRNFLYTELPEADFVEQYRRVTQYVRPELVLVAERQGEVVGFCFSVPDVLQSSRGKAIDTFIIKTVAVLPERELHGLGSVLVSRSQMIGRELGFTRCIHALMHEDNKSRAISRHYAETMRRYTLYARELA